MKTNITIKTNLDEEVTLTGNEWFVTMTDKTMSGWGLAEGRISKFVVICKTHGEAETLRDRIVANAKSMTYVKVTPTLPNYPVRRYHTSFSLNTGNLFNF